MSALTTIGGSTKLIIVSLSTLKVLRCFRYIEAGHTAIGSIKIELFLSFGHVLNRFQCVKL